MTTYATASTFHSLRHYQLRKPSMVSKIIVRGAGANIGLLDSDPSRILKFCIPENEDAVAELEEEKRICSLLGHHPFIAHFHWASEIGICFDYYPLGALRSYYEGLGAVPPSAVYDRVRWCQQAAAGFAFIHSKLIVHGDISPRNILLSPTMDIKICDFGFSRLVGEQLNGMAELRYCRFRPLTESDASFMDDVFAIGSLFYEILSCKAPYSDLDDETVIKRYQAHLFPSLEAIEPHSHAIAIEKCWGEEYHSIQELESHLSPALKDVTSR